MKKTITRLIDYAAANIVFTALVALWLLMVVGTVENVLMGADSWSTLGWVVFAPAVFFALVPLKSSDVRKSVWMFIKNNILTDKYAPRDLMHWDGKVDPLGISKRKPHR